LHGIIAAILKEGVMRYIVSISFFMYMLAGPVFSQKVPDQEIQRRVEAYKKDSRGPYKEIRWYCSDGTILPPQERCPEPGGVQRARHKEEVYALSLSNHVYLGQILSTTPFEDFWEPGFNHSRLKQYQLEKYLQGIDNGWVLRKAQFYRGAFQAEDEEAWGVGFYRWLLADDRAIESNFFLIRQSLKDVPHQGDNNLTQNIRALSRVISDTLPSFLDIRVKIHGQPDETDIERVVFFREKHKQELSDDLLKKFDELIRDMKTLYKPVEISSLKKYLSPLPADSELRGRVTSFITVLGQPGSPEEKINALSGLLYELREGILSLPGPEQRLSLLDLSIALEQMLLRELSILKMNTIRDHLLNIYNLGLAAAGCGYIEMWEWDQASAGMNLPDEEEVSLDVLVQFFESGRRLTEWEIGMFRAVYKDVIELFGGFEPLARGYIDDRIRSSLLLYSGSAVEKLADLLLDYRPAANHVMGIRGQNAIRGLNPGYATGELVVVTGMAENLEVDRGKIYIFDKPPSDLKPVAGIATVSEGNMVSHVQLLARNLGIPNAVITPQNLEELKKYSGETVFYAVSPGGSVILKPRDQITHEEQRLIETRQRAQEKLTVPVHRIDLEQQKIIDLNLVSARSSGIICGPKAANLGQLKRMFPDHVVEGIVIPFGIFRMHLDQEMPGQELSYWEYLNQMFEQSDQMSKNGASKEETEAYLLKELGIFRESIKKIRFSEAFLDDLSNSFLAVLGREIGEVPVFLRSDTNMEDLKDFTGAGLNLTLFNVVDSSAIIQGIRDVWASPYTERSYQWRQQYLLNPENVFPSILIIPSVDVDYSGVMVTRGISSQEDDDLTIAFNRGAGGAVEGQAAESYLLESNGGQILLSPAREPTYIGLPESGGSKRYDATFEKPVLNLKNLESLREMAGLVRDLLPRAPGIETAGPFDIELGFKDDKLWLFQVRPFVENKNAAASEYLNSLDPDFRKRMMIPILNQVDQNNP
jgi:hypothetical protein